MSKPSSPRWRTVLAVALAAGTAACSSSRKGGPSALANGKPLPGQPISPARDAAPASPPGQSLPPGAADAGLASPGAPGDASEVPLSCTPLQQLCNGGRACTQTVWDFEAGAGEKTGGWQTPGGKFTSAVVGEPFLATSGQAHGGAGALAVNLDVRPYRGIVQLARNFCGFTIASIAPLPSLDLRGRTLTAWVFLERAAGTGGDGNCFFSAYTADEQPRELGTSKPWTPIAAGTWLPVRTPLDEPFADRITDVALECQLRATSEVFTGTLYVDDVRVE